MAITVLPAFRPRLTALPPRDGRHQLRIVIDADLDFIGDDAVADMGDTALNWLRALLCMRVS
jgi:hypothetical protein